MSPDPCGRITQHLCHRDPEHGRDALELVERRHSVAALKAADAGLVDADGLGQPRLRQPGRDARPGQELPARLGRQDGLPQRELALTGPCPPGRMRSGAGRGSIERWAGVEGSAAGRGSSQGRRPGRCRRACFARDSTSCHAPAAPPPGREASRRLGQPAPRRPTSDMRDSVMPRGRADPRIAHSPRSSTGLSRLPPPRSTDEPRQDRHR